MFKGIIFCYIFSPCESRIFAINKIILKKRIKVIKKTKNQGTIDPELLTQLSDEQKQILFIKMRDEQLRKWRHFEDEMERSEPQEPPENEKTDQKVK